MAEREIARLSEAEVLRRRVICLVLQAKPTFPYNMEPYLFGRELNADKGPLREQATIQAIMKQLLENLK